MSNSVLNSMNYPHPTYDESQISARILHETRQAELDILFSLTGEVMLNEYQLTTDAHESAA